MDHTFDVDLTEATPDPFDRASLLEQADTQERVAHYSWLAAPEQKRNPDGSWPREDCCDCEEPIGEARLALGKVRCIECQTILDKTRRMYAR